MYPHSFRSNSERGAIRGIEYRVSNCEAIPGVIFSQTCNDLFNNLNINELFKTLNINDLLAWVPSLLPSFKSQNVDDGVGTWEAATLLSLHRHSKLQPRGTASPASGRRRGKGVYTQTAQQHGNGLLRPLRARRTLHIIELSHDLVAGSSTGVSGLLVESGSSWAAHGGQGSRPVVDGAEDGRPAGEGKQRRSIKGAARGVAREASGRLRSCRR